MIKVFFLSRKRPSDIGGLSRFVSELQNGFRESQTVALPQEGWRLLTIMSTTVDVIHATDATLLPIGYVLKMILAKPLTVTAHGLDLAFRQPWYQYLLRRLLPKANGIILDSKNAKTLLHGIPLPQTPIQIIHPGISTKHLFPTQPISLPKRPRQILLLTVGNLVLRKGHEWFIEKVFTRLPSNYSYLIIGDGSRRQYIEDLIKQLYLTKRIIMLGQLTHAQLGFIYRSTDIYVCPNRSVRGDFEGFGIACGEAASLGLPVIASCVDGLPEVIHHEKNGLLVPPNTTAFLHALRQLEDPKKRQNLGQRAKRYTRTCFPWSKTIKSYQEVFKGVIGKSAASVVHNSPR